MRCSWYTECAVQALSWRAVVEAPYTDLPYSKPPHTQEPECTASVSLNHSRTPPLTQSLNHSLTHSLTQSLVQSLAHSLSHSLTHSLLTYCLTRPLAQSGPVKSWVTERPSGVHRQLCLPLHATAREPEVNLWAEGALETESMVP